MLLSIVVKGNFESRDIFRVFFCFVTRARNFAQLFTKHPELYGEVIKKGEPKSG
jgi:hypothetical protein